MTDQSALVGQSPASRRRQAAENMRGILVIGLLAVLTALEFVVAIAIDDTVGLIAGLTPFMLTKAGLIFWYFMHVYRLWMAEEEHA